LESPKGVVGTQPENQFILSCKWVSDEIDGFIDEYRAICSNFIIILTGGDTEFLAKRLKNTIFANSNFLRKLEPNISI
jgi:type III pantothenate kinase